MPYFDTSEQWLKQSGLLLQARPSTTRITTKYKMLPPPASKTGTASESDAAPTTSTTFAPRANLTLKTYDPVSGVCLKYRTDKGAEVGRLIATLGRLGRQMAALPESAEPIDEVGADAAQDVEMTVDQGEKTAPAAKAGTATKDTGAAGKKKKKGKK